jgi:hypothetical protein
MCKEGKAPAMPSFGSVSATTFIFLALSMAPDLDAHGGRLNAEGCHHDRKRGGYHCHGGRIPPSREFALANDLSPNYDAPPRRAKPSRATRRAGVFANCSEARAAGAAPVRRGDPGYGPHLDRDGDGVGCKSRRRRLAGNEVRPRHYH